MSTPKKPKKRTLQITEAAPDDPIYSAGFVVGSKGNTEKGSNPQSTDSLGETTARLDKEMSESIPHQFGTDPGEDES